MKRFLLIITFLLTAFIITGFVITGCSTGNPAEQNTGVPQYPQQDTDQDGVASYVEGEVLVRLKPGADKTEVASLVDGDIIEQFKIGSMEYLRIRVTGSESVEKTVEILEKDKQIDYAEPNYIYQVCLEPNDPYFASRQYHHRRINSTSAWDVTTGSESVTIAIIDTGVDGTHPEFSGRMIGGYDYVLGKVLTGNENSDGHGHGTHVAGIAAATGNNSIGVAGVDWNAKIMPVRVLDNTGSGSTEKIAQGVGFAAENADVINLSLGGRGYSLTFQDSVIAAREKGVVVVVAMGNSYNKKLQFPAGYQGVMAVGSTDANDVISSFSTWGEWISVAAPGSEIFSTISGGSYRTANGTSMATPQVAGLAALLLAKNPGWSPSRVRTQIEDTTDDFGAAGFDQVYGYGRINAGRALTQATVNRYGTVEVRVTLDAAPYSISTILKNTSGKTVSTMRTKSGGKAVFFDIPAGSYTVGIAGTPNTVPVTVTAGEKSSVNLDYITGI
jgi:thermitase